MSVSKIKSYDYPVEYVVYARRHGVWIPRTRYTSYLGCVSSGENRSAEVAEFLRTFNKTYIPEELPEFMWSVY